MGATERRAKKISYNKTSLSLILLAQDLGLLSQRHPHSAFPFEVSHLHEPAAETSQHLAFHHPRESEQHGRTFLDKVYFIQVHLRHCLALSDPPLATSILPLLVIKIMHKTFLELERETVKYHTMDHY